MIEAQVLADLKENQEAARELLSHQPVNLVALRALAKEEARMMDILHVIWHPDA